ncbi:MAG: hypothetical protein C5B49_14465 [Bdellovibrio sp.]|nr:MAG: hypothetical protein C5B49_14465 [Bdellovibrio sp.]
MLFMSGTSVLADLPLPARADEETKAAPAEKGMASEKVIKASACNQVAAGDPNQPCRKDKPRGEDSQRELATEANTANLVFASLPSDGPAPFNSPDMLVGTITRAAPGPSSASAANALSPTAVSSAPAVPSSSKALGNK